MVFNGMDTSREGKCKGPRRASEKGPDVRTEPRRQRPGSRPSGKFPAPNIVGGQRMGRLRVIVFHEGRLTAASVYPNLFHTGLTLRECCTPTIGREMKRSSHNVSTHFAITGRYTRSQPPESSFGRNVAFVTSCFPFMFCSYTTNSPVALTSPTIAV